MPIPRCDEELLCADGCPWQALHNVQESVSWKRVEHCYWLYRALTGAIRQSYMLWPHFAGVTGAQGDG